MYCMRYEVCRYVHYVILNVLIYKYTDIFFAFIHNLEEEMKNNQLRHTTKTNSDKKRR